MRQQESITPGMGHERGSGGPPLATIKVDHQQAKPHDLATIARMQTDVGNAARFVLQHGDNTRFCFNWGKWLIYNGKNWLIDERGQILKLATHTALGIFDEVRGADERDREALASHALKSQRRDRIVAMVELAKPHLPIAPDEIDADPWLLNVENGTIDLRITELRPHRREDYLSKICRAKYDPETTAPIFATFLARTFRTHPGLIPFVQKALGYSCTGATREQVLFFCYGIGSNGKTTLLDTVSRVLGDYAGKTDPDLLIAQDGSSHPANVADLKGRRLAVCAETNEGRRFDEARAKDLVGETRIKARLMYGDFFEFNATHKIWLYSNHRPLVRGTDFGFWRRMRLIPFVETIGDDEKDKSLPDKLRTEADGILTWLMEGCRRWQADGLGLPGEVASATDDYRKDMDSIGIFLEECCLFGALLTASAKDLYASYVHWCEDEAGERPLSQKRLGTEIAKRGLSRERDPYTDRKIWLGIGLKVDAPVGRSFGNG